MTVKLHGGAAGWWGYYFLIQQRPRLRYEIDFLPGKKTNKYQLIGKKVVLMHTSLGLLNTRPKALGPPKEKDNSSPALTAEDPNVLKPFRHPDYKYLTYITTKNVREVLETKKLSGLAYRVGMERVMRWKPAFVSYPFLEIIGEHALTHRCYFRIAILPDLDRVLLLQIVYMPSLVLWHCRREGTSLEEWSETGY